MNFKKGDKVICVKTKGFSKRFDLKMGVYEVQANYNGEAIILTNGEGYLKHRFVKDNKLNRKLYKIKD